MPILQQSILYTSSYKLASFKKMYLVLLEIRSAVISLLTYLN